MTLPLVSILIPCYNAGRWLAATLESALAQTWPHIEVIVVDDGSSDDSPTVARAFEGRGVRLILQPNAGASAARNRALRESRGEFLQFLDADDLLSPGKIAAQISLLRQRSAGTVASCAWGRFADNPQTARFVDTPVFRVANRMGLSQGKTPRADEDDLEKIVPGRFKRHAHHWLILHGRYTCLARKPNCPDCIVRDLCTFEPKTKD